MTINKLGKGRKCINGNHFYANVPMIKCHRVVCLLLLGAEMSHNSQSFFSHCFPIRLLWSGSENGLLRQEAQAFTGGLTTGLRMSGCVGKTRLMCIPCCSLHCQCVTSALYNYMWLAHSLHLIDKATMWERGCHCQANRLQQSSTRSHRHIKPTLAGAVKLAESLIELIESIGRGWRV